MKLYGYVLQAEYARIKGFSRQNVTKLIAANKLEYIDKYNKKWIRYAEQNPSVLEKVLPFGFKMRSRSLAISNELCICDIKLLDPVDGKIVIRFYDAEDIIEFYANINECTITK